MEKSPLIQNERDVRSEELVLLESLVGYKALSESQQRLIRLSLYIQQRAVRGTDELSAENIYTEGEYTHVDTILSDDSELNKNPYRISQQVINNFYCHDATAGILYETADPDNNWQSDIFIESLNETVTSANHAMEADTLQHLQEFISTKIDEDGIPLRLHTWNEKEGVSHSALILGQSAGDYVLWEKEGAGGEFQLTTLSNLDKKYHRLTKKWFALPL